VMILILCLNELMMHFMKQKRMEGIRLLLAKQYS
jgi:hypothetical protein